VGINYFWIVTCLWAFGHHQALQRMARDIAGKADVKDINILLDGKVRHSTETLNPKQHTLHPKSYARDNKFDELSAENIRFRAP